MFRASPGHPPGKYFPSFGKIASEDLDVFVINVLHLFRTESAEFSSLEFSLWLQLSSFLYGFFIELKRLQIGSFFGWDRFPFSAHC